LDTVLKAICKIAKEYPDIRKVVLFGSRARGDFNDSSDYDIAVFGGDQNERMHFQARIDDIDTLLKIDILFVSDRIIGTPIYENIRKDGIILMDKFQTKLENYTNALARLHEGLTEADSNDSLIVRDGVIQRFEFTAELAWKTIREYLIAEEIGELNSPKAVMREAFANHIIADENGWLSVLSDRNATSHIYDESEADAIFERIKSKHILLFDVLLDKLQAAIQES